MGMSGRGNSIQANVDGLESYVKLFSGGEIITTRGPLGKQAFLKLCKMQDKNLVNRLLDHYI